MSSTYTEDHLVEQPAIQLMRHELGWDVVNCYDEWTGSASDLGRDGRREVVLTGRLKPALIRLNPDLPMEAIDGAVEEISRDRSALSLVEANREIAKLLKGGVRVSFPDTENGGQRTEVVAVVDWLVPENNDFLLVSQFWISGDLYTRRTDLLGFVNGLPLVLIELKKPGVNVREAFDKNLRDYKATIPQLFHYNALLIVSNGVQSKVGSLTLLCYLGQILVGPEGWPGFAGFPASSDLVFESFGDPGFEHPADFLFVGRALAALG